jgi:lipopolysaccharide export system ATP-binding protein
VNAVLEATGLRVVAGDKTLLRGVSLSVMSGEVVGILGPSGAGKSTLFRALAGDLAPAEGKTMLAGQDVTALALWQRARLGLAYVPQTPSVLWDFSVRENLRVYYRVVNGSRWPFGTHAGEDEAIARLASRVALADRLSVRAGDLSGGERRRLELARALTRTPKVLICDEPFAGVDPQQAGHLGELLAGLRHEGVAVLLSDHHVAEALRICTRTVLLLDGHTAMEGTPEEFRKHPVVVDRYLGDWMTRDPARR